MQRFVWSACVAVLIGLSLPALANPPKKSLRPHPRPVAEAPAAQVPVAPAPPVLGAEPLVIAPQATGFVGPKPKRRPENPVPVLAAAPSKETVTAAKPDPVGPRPKPRPAGLMASKKEAPETKEAPEIKEASAPAPEKERKGLFGFLRPAKRPEAPPKPTAEKTAQKKSVKGSVCGDPDIRGEVLARIPSKVKGCGIEKPVRVTQIAGIRLSTAATINCDTAKAIKKWIERGVVPTYGKGKVVELEIAASYSCRPRNNQRGAKISEHGRGNAIDIGGLTFSNGKSVSVLKDYDKNMRKIHKSACGIFGTTLGPGSDGYHENHLHFDVARYRNPYCR